MRDVLRPLIGTAENFGQAYDLFAPRLRADGSPDPGDRDHWLGLCEKIVIPKDYQHAYERWRSSFAADEAVVQEVAAKSRLLIGHGNPSGADVGLTVHRIWGVPVIPGSALKGLTAHYVDAVHGGDEPTRREWLGPTWRDGRVRKGAGAAFGDMFGAPAVDGEEGSERGGIVEFHDALYVPDPEKDNRPFARDVLTVHQKPYYDGKGADWPNDWTSPNPVGFITVRPGTRFLLALTGPNGWRELAMKLLLKALSDWGVGGKTSAGYGRLALVEVRRGR